MIRLIKTISQQQLVWRNDASVQKWTRGSEILGEWDQGKWLEKIRNDLSIQMFGILREPDKKPWSSITYGEKEEIIGTCGLTSITMLHRTAEFSLLIGPEHQRKGYGRQALKALLKYGFENLGLECIWGETFVYPETPDQKEEINPAWALFQEIGFKEEGRLRSRYWKLGKRIDTIMFSILRTEFYA